MYFMGNAQMVNRTLVTVNQSKQFSNTVNNPLGTPNYIVIQTVNHYITNSFVCPDRRIIHFF